MPICARPLLVAGRRSVFLFGANALRERPPAVGPSTLPATTEPHPRHAGALRRVRGVSRWDSRGQRGAQVADDAVHLDEEGGVGEPLALQLVTLGRFVVLEGRPGPAGGAEHAPRSSGLDLRQRCG